MKFSADHFRIGKADARDPDPVDYPRKSGGSGLFNAVHQILIRLFAKSFHLTDLLLITVQMENICIFFNITHPDEFFQCCF